VFEALFAETGAPLAEEFELLPVEPVTRYRFADGTSVELSADLERSRAALEAWSPGTGADWARLLATWGGMWRASEPVLRGPAPWPPRPDLARADTALSPAALLRVQPWRTLRGLARAHTRDPRLRMVIERFATYAGADPRRAPAALALAGYVEHAWGAWHPRGGMYALVQALVRRLDLLGGELRLGTPVRRILRDPAGRAAAGVETDAGAEAADAVVGAVDAEVVVSRLLGRPARLRERSLSGLAVMLGLRGATPGLVHHTIAFPADYDAEFDDLFVLRRPVRDPAVYVSATCATDPAEAPAGAENWFVLVNAPAIGGEADWEAEAERLVDRLGVRERVVTMAVRSPADLERETGAPGGSIYGVAPHGRLGTLRRPGGRVRGVPGLWLTGGTVHPGGGLPLVALGAATVAREIGPA
jgi:phytoene desaturase